jgi:hypothetical protein
MRLHTKVNGKLESVKVKVLLLGLMVANSSENG